MTPPVFVARPTFGALIGGIAMAAREFPRQAACRFASSIEIILLLRLGLRIGGEIVLVSLASEIRRRLDFARLAGAPSTGALAISLVHRSLNTRCLPACSPWSGSCRCLRRPAGHSRRANVMLAIMPVADVAVEMRVAEVNVRVAPVMSAMRDHGIGGSRMNAVEQGLRRRRERG